MAEAKQEFLGTGRRKTSVARVRLSEGSGKFLVNGRSLAKYFATETFRGVAVAPLQLIAGLEKYDVRVNVDGGGQSGQAGAVRHGLSRALIRMDGELRPQIKAEGFLTRDPRMRERKKPGQPGARKKFQYSKR
jgi:small subunit ribosomal protein S9